MKATLLLILLSSHLLLQGQDKEFLFQKGKKQKKAAVILLVTGGTSVVAGTIVSLVKASHEMTNLFYEAYPDLSYTAGYVMLIAGGAAIISSIPLFSASSRNLRKYQGHLSLNWKTVPHPANPGLSQRPYPALSIKFSL